MIQTRAYTLGRAEINEAMNIYGIKVVVVFMFSTSTVLLRTGIAQHWIAFLGFALAATLVLSIGMIEWIPFFVRAWVFLISAGILRQNLSVHSKAARSRHRYFGYCGRNSESRERLSF